jgi:DNA-binding MarR family transcriptional regulator
MYVIAGGTWTVPQVGRRLGVQRQSVQRIVDRLKDEGLVHLESNPDHATSPLLRLTPAGTQVLDAINRVADMWHEHVASAAGPEALRTTAEFLGWLRDLTDTGLLAEQQHTSEIAVAE